ncbi:MAG TPA: dTMP kinase [Rhabdaerophilum sp.]|nr:dTMP kinase [Rhabdaerophilum sp.]
MTRGLFITFEGGEGAGKSTQIRHLARWFGEQGCQTVVTREPGGTPLAEAVRGVLLGGAGTSDAVTQTLLFAAARRDNVLNVIRPALAAGQVVLCDRFADSTRAYQGGKLPDADIEVTIRLATDGLVPDLTLLLDLPPEVGLARARRRGTADRFENDELAFHESVRARFLALAKADPARFVVLDGTLVEDALAVATAIIVEARLGARIAGCRTP